MESRRIIKSAVFFCLIIVALNMKIKKLQTTEIKKLTIQDGIDNYDFAVKSGDNFVVKLDGNASTGFGWYLEQPDQKKNQDQLSILNPKNLNEKNGGEYEQTPAPEGMVGIPGFYKFEFNPKSVENKLIQLVLAYKRIWEKDVAPDRKVTINLNITI